MVTTIIVGLVSAAIGAFISTHVQRLHATWLKRRDSAAEAYTAALAVHSAVQSSLTLARRVDATAMSNLQDLSLVAQAADFNLTSALEASQSRLAKLREARLNVRSIWGPAIADIFDAFFELTSAWHNALVNFADAIHGHTEYQPYDFDVDATGFNWSNVVAGRDPDAQIFERATERLMEMIRRFAASAGVVISELLGLPWGAQEVARDFAEYREQLRLTTTAHRLPDKG